MLFADDDDEEEDNNGQQQQYNQYHPPRKPSILKPLDLNLDFDGEATSPTTTSGQNDGGGDPAADGNSNNNVPSIHSPPRHNHHRNNRRHSHQPESKTPHRGASSRNHHPQAPGSAVRKRQAENHDILYRRQDVSFEKDDNNATNAGGDDDVFSTAMESPVDMYASPHISPSSPPSAGGSSSVGGGFMVSSSGPGSVYRQNHPNSRGTGGASSNNTGGTTFHPHKSPSSFRTLDGRTVQSKNPFSPMIFEEQPTPGSMMDTSIGTHVSSARAKMELRHSPYPTNSTLFLNMNEPSICFPASLSGGSIKKISSNNTNVCRNVNDDGNNNDNQGNLTITTNNTNLGGGLVDGPPRMLLPRHTLHKRDNKNETDAAVSMGISDLAPLHTTTANVATATTYPDHQQQVKESYYTRDGYPEKSGRYSFTGSPIKEHTEFLAASSPPVSHEEHLKPPAVSAHSRQHQRRLVPPPALDDDGDNDDVCSNFHKIRRRTKGDDVIAAAAQGESSWKRKGGMYIQTNNNNNNNNKQNSDQNDNISPTDVANFPLFRPSPSDTKTLPPTPSKPVRRPPVKRYTPIRRTQGPPPTPMPSIRKARSFDDDDFDTSSVDSGDNNNRRRHSSSSMDYLSLSPGGSDAKHQQQMMNVSAPPPSRFYSDFDVIAELGNGSFGNVYKVLSRLDGCMYAIKVAHRPAKGNADKDRMLKEVYALAALSDQADTATFHIVRYHQAWMEEQRLYIQTELCTTTLQAEMQQFSPMAMPLVRRYKCLREILLALDFIHKNGMVHLDIKPENIFVSISHLIPTY